MCLDAIAEGAGPAFSVSFVRPSWSWKTDPPVDQCKFLKPITHVKKLQRLLVMPSLHFPTLPNNQRKRDTCETLHPNAKLVKG